MAISRRAAERLCQLIEVNVVDVTLGRVRARVSENRLQRFEVAAALAKEAVGEAVTKLVRGERSNAGASRTYLRPRDMIQFCNLCLKQAQAAGDDRISNEDITRARRGYSDYLIDELDDEIHAAHPDWHSYLDVLRRTHTMRFARSDFEKAFDALRLQKRGLDVDAALEMLYRYGIIGFAKIGGGGYGGRRSLSHIEKPELTSTRPRQRSPSIPA
jgi:hypothetical protein